MSWNDGYERKKFMARMKKQAEEYRAAGMTEEQIKAMYEFDLGVYKSDRNYYSHTQEYEASSFDEGVDDSDNALLNRNADAFSVSYEERYFNDSDPFSVGFEDERLNRIVQKFNNPRDIRILKMLSEGITEAQIAVELGVTNQAISKRVQKFKGI